MPNYSVGIIGATGRGDYGHALDTAWLDLPNTSIIAVADAQAAALDTVGKVAKTEEGQKAIQLNLADKAIEAKRAIAKDSTVVLLPESNSNAANVVAEAMTIINTLNNDKAIA